MNWLVNTDGFPARWFCGEGWANEPYLGWAHIVSDVVTWLAYMAIPIVLAYFTVKRKDVAFPGVFWLFCAFIVSCGMVHLFEAITFWTPLYRLSAVLKVVTAIVSAATVLALIRTLPKALALPGLATINAELSESQAELKKYATRLERSNNDLTDFAYIASHDLRSPLNGIAQLAAWIEEDEAKSLSDSGRKNLELLQGRVLRMERLLEDLLAYAKIGNSGHEAKLIDTTALMQDAAAMIAPPDGFSITWDEKLPGVTAHPTPLRMVFMNLISNAVKHCRSDSGSLHVSANERGEFVEFLFADSGPGIDPEFHGKIFALFQTLDNRDVVEGSGMGLAFVKRTTEEYGGSITVESQLGEGATFKVRWPKFPLAAQSA